MTDRELLALMTSIIHSGHKNPLSDVEISLAIAQDILNVLPKEKTCPVVVLSEELKQKAESSNDMLPRWQPWNGGIKDIGL